jgi:hypothetical protein
MKPSVKVEVATIKEKSRIALMKVTELNNL